MSIYSNLAQLKREVNGDTKGEPTSNPTTSFVRDLKGLVKESDLEQVAFAKIDIQDILVSMNSVKTNPNSNTIKDVDNITAVGIAAPFLGAVAESTGYAPKGTMSSMLTNAAAAVKLAGTVIGLATVASDLGFTFQKNNSTTGKPE